VEPLTGLNICHAQAEVVRRLLVVENGRLVGIIAQADIALRENEQTTGELVEAISARSEGERS
jgi:predicted transcriptional regulator